MTFNPFNLFKGNPKVLELMTQNKPIQELLLEQAFVSQFKKSENEPLQSYMNYERYQNLVTYITKIQCDQSDKNRAFKFPYVASEILAVNNDFTYKFLLEEVVFTEELIQQQVEIQKEIDSESSDRSYSSIKSNNSSTSKKEIFEQKQFEECNKENFVIRTEADKTLVQFDFKDEKDICQEDFPDVKHKRTILVNQIIKRTVKKPYQPLIFRLLEYFDRKEVVHILDGYVCKTLDNLINNRFEAFMKIINKYESFNRIKKIFSHLQSNSVQQFLLNLITRLMEMSSVEAYSDQITFISFMQQISEIPFESWPQSEAILCEKGYIIGLYFSALDKIHCKIISKFQKQKQKDENSINQSNYNEQISQLSKLLKAEHLSNLSKNLIAITQTEKNTNMFKIISNYAKLLKFLLRSYVLLKNELSKVLKSEDNKKKIKDIVENCEQSFDSLIPVCYTYIFEDFLLMDKQQLKKYKPNNSLLSKMEFIQILGILSKENIYFSRRSILDHPYFDHLLRLLDLYPKSSIFHNGITQIILPFLDSQNQAFIIDKLLKKQTLFTFIFEIVKADSELRYQKKQRSRKCYISQLTSICLALQKLQKQQSEQLSQYKQSYQWQFIHECLIQDQKSLRKKLLGGHQKLRNKKPQIFFSKEECLENFKHFLSGTKLNMFDDFQNYDPGHSDSQEDNDLEHIKQQLSGLSTASDMTKEEIVPEKEGDDSKYFAEDFTL